MKTSSALPVRCYAKAELAMLYFPDASPHVALNRLNAWIRRCQPLRQALAGCYLPPHGKSYSAQAVRLIVHYLGEP